MPLGRALAATEKRTRERAMGSVEAWVSAPVARTELDYLKLWKALWYAMYMTDKPGPQEKLSFQLASLVRAAGRRGAAGRKRVVVRRCRPYLRQTPRSCLSARS